MVNSLNKLKQEIDSLSSNEKKELLNYLEKSMQPKEPLYPTKSGTLKETTPAEESKDRLKKLKRKFYW